MNRVIRSRMTIAMLARSLMAYLRVESHLRRWPARIEPVAVSRPIRYHWNVAMFFTIACPGNWRDGANISGGWRVAPGGGWRVKARIGSDRIGLTPEVGGPASRPNHALTDVVTMNRATGITSGDGHGWLGWLLSGRESKNHPRGSLY